MLYYNHFFGVITMYNDDYDVSSEDMERQIRAEMDVSKCEIKYCSSMIWSTRKFRLMNQIEMGLIGGVTFSEIALWKACFSSAFSQLSPVTQFFIGVGVLCLPPVMYYRVKSLLMEQKLNHNQLSIFKDERENNKQYYDKLKDELIMLQKMTESNKNIEFDEHGPDSEGKAFQKQKYKR